jgi:hypothetical protein
MRLGTAPSRYDRLCTMMALIRFTSKEHYRFCRDISLWMVMGMTNLTLYSPTVLGYMWFFLTQSSVIIWPNSAHKKEFWGRVFGKTRALWARNHSTWTTFCWGTSNSCVLWKFLWEISRLFIETVPPARRARMRTEGGWAPSNFGRKYCVYLKESWGHEQGKEDGCHGQLAHPT